ncbi:MAG TPA: 16S rRNA (adenine(1518)-N(6)/adenine(1519)-N(6))-dimethyltransferase RsmA [Bacilli bacterium]|nr:16S rRNA (adenine(1518)-N(6)/adenine(1519)-N(6))-dimethyltransferase RsmA [Bacilli bacterium]
MKVAKKETVINLLSTLMIRPLKRYGQNFLIDEEVAKDIVEQLCLTPQDNILEIGPGLGALTHYLVNSPVRRVELVEIDRTTANYLASTYEKDARVKVSTMNILRYDFSLLAQPTKIIGNLPYYITTPILEELMKAGPALKSFTVMIQSEVIDRLLAPVKSKDYGPLPIMIALFGEGKRVFKVGPNKFFPQPHVGSAVFSYSFSQSRERKYLQDFFRFLKQLFNNRRKTIYNNLYGYLHDENKTKNVLIENGLDLQLRPEAITPLQWEKLFNTIREL